jgi:hypothetical protein
LLTRQVWTTSSAGALQAELLSGSGVAFDRSYKPLNFDLRLVSVVVTLPVDVEVLPSFN